ncbi:hypothetical protein GCK72_024841 [Caenorhabditis remanei]|uniref:Uncharacterized protein n=1 Tax=Caenorhabditis remanei TaxID=31234 RepID=A0A6A5G166_CAERE|nr:hypothetical protein GCK72_024841 [Caenorhabditis remanei]KAF1748374.1 hypothetical protein GCK72_024841 [Caenorhabditis remanei]
MCLLLSIESFGGILIGGSLLVLLVLGYQVVHVAFSLSELHLIHTFTNCGLDIVRDPVNEIGGVLVLDIEHLFINLLHAHSSTEDSGGGQITSMSWITGGHHVLSIETLLGKCILKYLLVTSAGQRSKSRHEEMKTREWNHVDCQLTEIRIELTGETKASGDTTHCGTDQMVEVSVCWGS